MTNNKDESPKSKMGAKSESPDQVEDALLRELRHESKSDREVFARLQNELRRIARNKMRFERPGHSLEATELVNEAFIKLFKGEITPDFWVDSARAVKFIAHAMEQILNDHADAYRAKKRGGPLRKRVPLDQQQAKEILESGSFAELDSVFLIRPEQSEAIIGVREALALLREAAPRQASVVQLQFYGGLTQEEIASSLDISRETVKLDTKKAKSFLKLHLAKKAV
jgi:RNA polymerase sigma-70 factor, ECF subfamily